MANQYVFASLSGPTIDLQNMPILAKKLSFQMKLILILAGMETSKIVPFGAQKTRTHTLKSRRTQNETLFGAEFGLEAKLVHFYSQMRTEWPLQSMAIVIGPCCTNFCSQKLRRKIWTIFGFKRTAWSRSYNFFALCFWRLHYHQQGWCRLATSEMRFNTVRLLFVWCRQR